MHGELQHRASFSVVVVVVVFNITNLVNSDSANLECFIPEWVEIVFTRHTKRCQQK